MTTPSFEKVDLPESLHLHAQLTAHYLGWEFGDYLRTAVESYLDTPGAADLPLMPSTDQRMTTVPVSLPPALENRAWLMHPLGTSRATLISRALYYSLDVLEPQKEALRTQVELSQDSFNSLLAAAAAQGLSTDHLVRRLLSDYLFQPQSASADIQLPEGGARFQGGCLLDPALLSHMSHVMRRHDPGNGGRADSTYLIQRAVEQFLAAPIPAAAPPPSKPVITPANRAKSKRLRL